MKCKCCNARWNIGNINPHISNCPVCGKSYVSDKDIRIIENYKELFIVLLNEEGRDICNNSKRIIGFVKDYFPEKYETNQLIIDLLDVKLGTRIYDFLGGKGNYNSVIGVIDSIDTGEKKLMIQKCVNFLCGIDEESYSTSDKDFYVSQIERLNTDEYKIRAIEKALGYGDDTALIETLIELKKKVGDIQEAEKLIKKNAELGSGIALYQMACKLILEKQYDEAIAKLEDAAKIDETQSCFKLYKLLYRNNSKRKEAIKYLKQASDNKYIPAMYEYSVHLLYGDDVKEDIDTAISMLEYCAEGDYLDAKSKLRYIYSVGYKVSKDRDRAKLYR